MKSDSARYIPSLAGLRAIPMALVPLLMLAAAAPPASYLLLEWWLFAVRTHFRDAGGYTKAA